MPPTSLSHLRNHTTLKQVETIDDEWSSLSHLRNHTTLKRKAQLM